jgi:hypothetical protein
MIGGTKLLKHALIINSCFNLHPKFPKIKQALIMLFSFHLHSELFAIQCVFRGNFLNPGSLILRSNLRHLWDCENGEIDHKSNKRRPQSGFHVVINSADLIPISRWFHRLVPV